MNHSSNHLFIGHLRPKSDAASLIPPLLGFNEFFRALLLFSHKLESCATTVHNWVFLLDNTDLECLQTNLILFH